MSNFFYKIYCKNVNKVFKNNLPAVACSYTTTNMLAAPSACASVSTNTTTTKSTTKTKTRTTTSTTSSTVRKKRQATSSPSSPPPVNADFEAAALFLMTYMELEEDDRIAIGHRLVIYKSYLVPYFIYMTLLFGVPFGYIFILFIFAYILFTFLCQYLNPQPLS